MESYYSTGRERKIRNEKETEAEMRAWQYGEYRRKVNWATLIFIILVVAMIIGFSIAFLYIGEKVYPYCLGAFFVGLFAFYGVIWYRSHCPFCGSFIGRSRYYGDCCPSCGRLMKAAVREELFYLEQCPHCAVVIGRTVAPYETCPMCEAQFKEGFVY